MTLDPQAAAHLDAVLAAGAPAIHELTVSQARAAGLGYLGMQRPARPVAELVHRFIPGPTADLPVRIYRPTPARGGPAIVLFHGSGWVICNLDVCDEPARALALDTGYTVVTVNYQKAPEHPFPVPLQDCYATLCWVAEHAAELGIDPARLAVAGDSAGGNLAAAVALYSRDHGGPAIAAQALLYPALTPRLDLPSHTAPTRPGALSAADMRWFWNHYLPTGDGSNPYAGPLLAADLTSLPPAYLASAGHDVLRDDAVRYAERLRAAGVPVTHEDYPGMIHGFHWMDAVLDESLSLQRNVAAWLRGTLGT